MSFIGNIGQATDSASITAEQVIASRYEASVDFVALTMLVVLSTDFTSDNAVRLGIYSDDGGEPGVLMGYTDEISGLGIEDGVYHAYLTPPVTIVAGEFYWLAILAKDAVDARATSTATGDSRVVNDDYSDGFAYAFGAGGSSDTVALCIGALSRVRGGFCRGSLAAGGAVMQEPEDGVIWGVVKAETGDIVVYRNLGGVETPALVAAATPTEIFGSAATTVGWVDAALDGEGLIHIVCQPATALNTRDVAYCTFDMATEVFGTWEEAAALTGTATGLARVAIDDDNRPHVVYVDKPAAAALIMYTNKVSGSWLAPEQVCSSSAVNHYSPDIALDAAGDVHVVYSVNAAAGYRKRTSGSWGTEDTSAAVVVFPSLAVAGVTPKMLAPLYGAGVRDVYFGEDVDTLADSGINSDEGTATINVVSLALFNGVPVMVYVEATSQVIKAAYFNGSVWIDGGTLWSFAAFDAVVAEWAFYHEDQHEAINYLYSVSSFVYCSSCLPFETINRRSAVGGSTLATAMSRAPQVGMFGGLNG